MGVVLDFNAAKLNPPPRREIKRKKKKKHYGLARAMNEYSDTVDKQHAPKKDGEE